MRSDVARSLGLCILSLIGYGLTFAIQVVLARNLDTSNFHDYNVAVAVLMIASTVTTLGFEKYALYLLPVLQERRDWARTRGFLRSSAQVILTVSIALVVLTIVSIEGVFSHVGLRYHLTISIAIAALPAMAWGLFMVEAITSYGHEWIATFVYRVAFPIVLLVAIGYLLGYHSLDNAAAAAAALCTTWWLTTLGLMLVFRRVRPPESLHAKPRLRTAYWTRRSMPLSIFSILLVVQGNIGILVLDRYFHEDQLVAEYAVAQTIGTFLLLIATATNRFYLPLFSLHIERSEVNHLHRVLRERRWWVAAVIIGFVLLIRAYGDQVLLIFGRPYVHSHPALMVILFGTSLSVLFAPAPYLLQFIGQSRLVVMTSAITCLTTVAMSVLLVDHWGTVGVAFAYAAPLGAQFIFMKSMLHRWLPESPSTTTA